MTGLILGAIIISFSSVMVKVAGAPPDVTGFYRLFGGGIGMGLILWQMGKLHTMTPRVWKWSLLAAVFFMADMYFWHRSIGFVGVGLATMLGNFQVIVLAVVSIIVMREKVTRAYLLSIPMALIGLYLMVGISWDTFTPNFKTGVIYGLLTALAYGLYLLSLKYSLNKSNVDPFALACAVALSSGLLLGGLSVAQGESFIIRDTQAILALAALALICQACGWFLITRGIQLVRTSLVGLVLLLQPTLSYLWDILFFDKQTSPVELAGVCLALTAIYLGSLKKSNTQ